MYAAEYHAQAAIGAALALRQRRLDPATIDHITVHTYAHALQGIGSTDAVWHATDVDTMLHSMPYLVSVALLDGDVSPAQFAPPRLVAPDVRALMARTSVVEDPAITSAYVASVSTRVEVLTGDGQTHTATCEQPAGHAANPLTDAQIEAQFNLYAGGRLRDYQRRVFLGRVWELERFPRTHPLLESFRHPPRHE